MAQPLIKFFRASAAPTEGLVQGAIWFNPSNNEIRVYNGTAWLQYSGLVKNVEYAEATKILTITPFEGEATTINLENFVKGYISVVDVLDPKGTASIVNSETKKAELSQVTATTISVAESDCSDNKFATEAAVRKAINALDKPDTAVAGQYVSAVSEVDGVITVTRANLPAESADVDSLDGKTGVITTLKNQETVGAINLEVDANNQLKATLVGSFENGAQVNKLEGVKLNGTALTIAEDKTVNVTAIEGIVENDKVLSKSGNNIMSTLSLDYETQGEGNAAKKYIVLKGINGVEIDKIDASDFVADSFLNDVEIKKVDGKDVLYFTWAMADGTTKTDSVDLSSYIDVYTGAKDEITVSADNVIGLATVTQNNNDKVEKELAHSTATTPSNFAAVTGVTVDTKGRVTGVEKTTFTMPKLDITEHAEEGEDDYVKVTVTTENGSVKSVAVNTDALSTKISGIEADLTEVAQVTAAALVDLDSRLDSVEAGTITSVTGEANELNNTAYVNVKATTENGAVTLASSVKAVEATDKTKYPSTGLATDGYVNEKVATVAATAGTAVQKIESKDATIQVTRAEGSNDVNLELAWTAFE